MGFSVKKADVVTALDKIRALADPQKIWTIPHAKATLALLQWYPETSLTLRLLFLGLSRQVNLNGPDQAVILRDLQAKVPSIRAKFQSSFPDPFCIEELESATLDERGDIASPIQEIVLPNQDLVRSLNINPLVYGGVFTFTNGRCDLLWNSAWMIHSLIGTTPMQVSPAICVLDKSGTQAEGVRLGNPEGMENFFRELATRYGESITESGPNRRFSNRGRMGEIHCHLVEDVSLTVSLRVREAKLERRVQWRISNHPVRELRLLTTAEQTSDGDFTNLERDMRSGLQVGMDDSLALEPQQFVYTSHGVLEFWGSNKGYLNFDTPPSTHNLRTYTWLIASARAALSNPSSLSYGRVERRGPSPRVRLSLQDAGAIVEFDAVNEKGLPLDWRVEVMPSHTEGVMRVDLIKVSAGNASQVEAYISDQLGSSKG